MTNQEVRARLAAMAEPGYREFQAALIPNLQEELWGVRMPALRKLGKQILKGDWKEFLKDSAGDSLHEVKLLRGLVIAGAPWDYGEKLHAAADYLPEITNWALCDTFCGELKDAGRHLPETWEFLQPCLQSGREYDLRFGLVMLMDYFLTEEYIQPVLDILFSVSHTGYYARMGQAWAISAAFVEFREPTLMRLEAKTLTPWVQNKAIQKCRESYRVSREDKALLQKLKTQ